MAPGRAAVALAVLAVRRSESAGLETPTDRCPFGSQPAGMIVASVDGRELPLWRRGLAVGNPSPAGEGVVGSHSAVVAGPSAHGGEFPIWRRRKATAIQFARTKAIRQDRSNPQKARVILFVSRSLGFHHHSASRGFKSRAQAIDEDAGTRRGGEAGL